MLAAQARHQRIRKRASCSNSANRYGSITSRSEQVIIQRLRQTGRSGMPCRTAAGSSMPV